MILIIVTNHYLSFAILFMQLWGRGAFGFQRAAFLMTQGMSRGIQLLFLNADGKIKRPNYPRRVIGPSCFLAHTLTLSSPSIGLIVSPYIEEVAYLICKKRTKIKILNCDIITNGYEKTGGCVRRIL